MIERPITIQKGRQKLEIARDRLHLIVGKDKEILAAYLDGQSLRHIARLSGITRPALHRKLRKLITALSGPPAEKYLLTLHNRHKFSPAELYIARDRLLLGLSFREIATKRKITFYRSYHTVCKIERRLEQCKRTQSRRTFSPATRSKSAKRPPVPAGCSA